MYLSNIKEIKDEMFSWPYPRTWLPKPPLPRLSKNTEYVRRGVKARKLNRKLFLRCGVALPNLSMSVNHHLLFKKPRIYLRKKTCVPKINLRVWPDDYPHFRRYIYGLYLVDGGDTVFMLKGKRSTDEDSFQVNVGSPPLAYINLRRSLRNCNDFLSKNNL